MYKKRFIGHRQEYQLNIIEKNIYSKVLVFIPLLISGTPETRQPSSASSFRASRLPLNSAATAHAPSLRPTDVAAAQSVVRLRSSVPTPGSGMLCPEQHGAAENRLPDVHLSAQHPRHPAADGVSEAEDAGEQAAAERRQTASWAPVCHPSLRTSLPGRWGRLFCFLVM